MSITYKYFGPFKNESTDKTFYLWDIYNNGELMNSKRAVPVKDVSPDVWDAEQNAIKESAKEKLVALGFTAEEATLICLNQD